MRYSSDSQSSQEHGTTTGFGAYGLETMAYIKPVMIEGKAMHAVHAADGTPLAMVAGRDVAFATVRQHEMEPASVH